VPLNNKEKREKGNKVLYSILCTNQTSIYFNALTNREGMKNEVEMRMM